MYTRSLLLLYMHFLFEYPLPRAPSSQCIWNHLPWQTWIRSLVDTQARMLPAALFNHLLYSATLTRGRQSNGKEWTVCHVLWFDFKQFGSSDGLSVSSLSAFPLYNSSAYQLCFAVCSFACLLFWSLRTRLTRAPVYHTFPFKRRLSCHRFICGLFPCIVPSLNKYN